MALRTPMERKDPVGDKYYTAIRRLSGVSDALFFLSMALSFVILYMPGSEVSLNSFIQVVFATITFYIFISSMAARLYFGPRAQEQRIADLMSNSFGVNIVDMPSTGYYNNDETEALRRLNALVMENAFFSMNVVSAMIPMERIIALSYLGLWTAAVVNRSTDLAFITIAAQVLLSEQVLSRWLRVEFLKSKAEKCYRTAYEIAALEAKSVPRQARTVHNAILYEAWKAQAGIPISSRLFTKLNDQISKEWEEVGTRAGVIKGRVI